MQFFLLKQRVRYYLCFLTINLFCFALAAFESVDFPGQYLKKFLENHPDQIKNTLVVFDIDNTLITPTGWVGDSKVYYTLVNELVAERMKKKKYFPDVAGRKKEEEKRLTQEVRVPTSDMFTVMDHYIDYRITDSSLPQIIRELKAKGAIVLALTSRISNEYSETMRRFKKFDIVLSDHLDKLESVVEKINHSEPGNAKVAMMKNGIFFVGPYNKGEAMVKLLEGIKTALKKKIEKVVFIDDNKGYLEQVERNVHQIHSFSPIPELFLVQCMYVENQKTPLFDKEKAECDTLGLLSTHMKSGDIFEIIHTNPVTHHFIKTRCQGEESLGKSCAKQYCQALLEEYAK